jgi:hypothetical protein
MNFEFRNTTLISQIYNFQQFPMNRGRRGCDSMIVGFTTTYVIST